MATPTLATAPDALPRLKETESAHSPAASITSFEVNISFKDCQILCSDFLIFVIFFSLSPNPIRNPLRNKPANFFTLSIRPARDWSIFVITVSPCARLPKSMLPPEVAPVPPFPPEPPELSEAGLSIFCIWSKPINTRISLAAFFAALPAPAAPSARSSAAPAAPLKPSSAFPAISDMPEDAFFPVISSVKDLNAFANITNLPTTALIPLIIGVNRFINPCPIDALRLSNCRERMRTWFAQESEVLAKSPLASDN